LNRRKLLGTLLAVPGVGLALTAEGTEYASALDVFVEIDRLEAEVELRLRALAEAASGAKALAVSMLADFERERKARARLRRRLGLPASPVARPEEVTDLTSLDALRTVQEALVHAHAEGLPALRDSYAVQVMASHMVELSRHLAVIDLWIESEQSRG
jgi:hypothetical protein